MHLKFRNVNDAFRGIVSSIHTGKICTTKRSSRNGYTLTVEEPVIISYSHPCERVLFNSARNASPFFHLYEALWMLAGRNDVESVAYYAKQMREYSDDGETLNGAYGYRWRGQYLTIETEIPPSKKFPYGCRESEVKRIDQLDILVDHLKAQPESRRAVLQMWNVEDDLLKVGRGWGEFKVYMEGVGNNLDDFTQAQLKDRYDEWNVSSKDVCCNLSVMFSVRTTRSTTREHVLPTVGVSSNGSTYLDMTVTNRSNDLIWGLLGANFVHFTILQEYMAARLGVEVGVYHHFTNNLHAYDWNWKPEEWLVADKGVEGSAVGGPVYLPTKNGQPTWNHVPLVKDPAKFEEELSLFVRHFDGSKEASVVGRDSPNGYSEPFLRRVAQPALMAFQAYKRKNKGDVEAMLVALEWAREIEADDWRIACTNWLNRRTKSPVKE